MGFGGLSHHPGSCQVGAVGFIHTSYVYDDEVDNAVDGMTSLIEPIMIVVLALIVGTIVIALFLPMIEIIKKMNA